MKSKLLLILFVFNLLIANCFCQNFDQVWVVGFGDGKLWNNNDISAVMFLDYSGNRWPQISFQHEIDFEFYVTDASICDSAGRLQFYSNGASINSHNHQTMLNGNSISVGSNFGGVRAPQGALALPFPSKKGWYLLFNVQDGYFNNNNNVGGMELYTNVINMSGNNRLGEVTKRKETLVSDTIDWGRILATKHANGRDWWIMVPENSTNSFYVWLLDINGVHLIRKQRVGVPVEEGLGQVAFSPDGRYYVKAKSTRIGEFPQFDLYDFTDWNGFCFAQRCHDAANIGLPPSRQRRPVLSGA